MSKLSRERLRKLIKNEIRKIVDEEMLLEPPKLGDHGWARYNSDRDEDNYEEYDENHCDEVISEDCGCSKKQTKGHEEMDIIDIMKIKDRFPDASHIVGIEHDSKKSKKSGSYMSKSQLHKIVKYAHDLQILIPKNYDLEDWMRTKISQIADDISEVYHALDYRDFKGEI